MLTAVSLFAGIGGIDLALERAGVKVVAAVEIDPAARGVLADRFPGVKLFNDVCEVTGDELRAAGFVPDRGILAGGWPCTGNSVAGRRQGFNDPRSGLWRQVVRLLDETRPAWFLGENVPGLLSVNGGDDWRQVLDDLTSRRYVVDVNIYDAQFFGVPQRRRRVFLTCQSVDDLVRRKTSSSALVLAQCLIEISLLSLVVLSRGSARGLPPWDSPENCVAGLRQRMQNFGLEQPSVLQSWPHVLAEAPARRGNEPSSSGSVRGVSTPAADLPTEGTSSPGSTEAASGTSLSTVLSWKTLLADLLPIARSCTTSTPSRQTTTSGIYTCARALLSISEYIAALSDLSPTCWQPVSSASTAIEVLTSYARSTDGDLLAWMDGLHDFVDLVAPAERLLVALRHLGDGAAPAEVLLEPEGGGGDSPEGRAAGAGASVASALSASGGGPDDNDATGNRLIVGPLQAQGSDGRGHRVDADGAASGHLVTAPLRGNHHGDHVAAESHLVTALTTRAGSTFDDQQTGQLVPVLATALRARDQSRGVDSDATDTLIAFDAAQITHPENRVNPQPGDPAMPLAATGQPHVAYASRRRRTPSVAQMVRRLTPTECERLQGFPDRWTATSNGQPQSDSARYRELGNSVAVPVVEWIIRRLIAIDAGPQP